MREGVNWYVDADFFLDFFFDFFFDFFCFKKGRAKKELTMAVAVVSCPAMRNVII